MILYRTQAALNHGAAMMAIRNQGLTSEDIGVYIETVCGPEVNTDEAIIYAMGARDGVNIADFFRDRNQRSA